MFLYKKINKYIYIYVNRYSIRSWCQWRRPVWVCSVTVTNPEWRSFQWTRNTRRDFSRRTGRMGSGLAGTCRPEPASIQQFATPPHSISTYQATRAYGWHIYNFILFFAKKYSSGKNIIKFDTVYKKYLSKNIVCQNKHNWNKQSSLCFN